MKIIQNSKFNEVLLEQSHTHPVSIVCDCFSSLMMELRQGKTVKKARRLGQRPYDL